VNGAATGATKVKVAFFVISGALLVSQATLLPQFLLLEESDLAES